MYKIIKNILILSELTKLQIFINFFGLLILICLETLSIGIVIPLLEKIANLDQSSYKFVNYFNSFIEDFSEEQQIGLICLSILSIFIFAK